MRNARRFETATAAITALAAVLALAIGVFTPPRGVILCTSGCIGYLYTDAAPFMAGDSVWIYPAIVMAIAFVALTASLRELAPRPAAKVTRPGRSYADFVRTPAGSVSVTRRPSASYVEAVVMFVWSSLAPPEA